jgi:hypothetical protein
MLILAFGHEKGVGKDTAARFAMTHLRSNNRVRRVEIRGFADKLKDVCHQMYSWAGLMPGDSYEEPGNRHLKEVALPLLNKSPRQIWISVGNGVRDWVFDGTWLEWLLINARADFLLVKDMRFPTEADRIRALGGTVVKIVRPDVPHTSDGADDPLLTYARWDHTITNTTGDLDRLYESVVGIVEGMLLKAGGP